MFSNSTSGRRAQDIARLPVGVQQVLLDGVGGRPGAFQDADPPRAGLGHQVRRRGDHLRMRVVRVLERQIAQPVGRRAGQVDLDRYRLALDQALQPAQLVEHLLHGGQQFGCVIGPAARHRDRRCRRRGGVRQPRSGDPATGDTRRRRSASIPYVFASQCIRLIPPVPTPRTAILAAGAPLPRPSAIPSPLPLTEYRRPARPSHARYRPAIRTLAESGPRFA